MKNLTQPQNGRTPSPVLKTPSPLSHRSPASSPHVSPKKVQSPSRLAQSALGAGQGPVLRDGRVPHGEQIRLADLALASIELHLAELSSDDALQMASRLEQLASTARKRARGTKEDGGAQKRTRGDEAEESLVPLQESAQPVGDTLETLLARAIESLESMPSPPASPPERCLFSPPPSPPQLPTSEMPAEWFENPRCETLVPEGPVSQGHAWGCMSAAIECGKMCKSDGGFSRNLRLSHLVRKEVEEARTRSPKDPIQALLNPPQEVHWRNSSYFNGKGKIDISDRTVFRLALHVLLLSRPGMNYQETSTGEYPQGTLRNVLDYGLRIGHMEFVRLARMQGLIVTGGTGDVRVLSRVVAKGSVATLEALLDHGFPVNGQDAHGNTPLHTAMQSGSEMSAFLIERGARLDITNKRGEYPVDVALRHSNQALFCSADQINFPAKAKADEHPSWAFALLQRAFEKMGIEEEVGDHHLALLPPERLVRLEGMAVTRRESQLIRELKRFRTDLFDGFTPPVLDWLYEATQPDVNGQTPLHVASVRGYLVGVQNLIFPETLDYQDRNGDTPLHLALWRGHHDVAACLLEAGARLDVENAQGVTPLDYVPMGEHYQAFVNLVAQYSSLPPKRSLLEFALMRNPEAIELTLFDDLVPNFGRFEPGEEWSDEEKRMVRTWVRNVFGCGGTFITAEDHPAFHLIGLPEVRRLMALRIEEDGETLLTRALKQDDFSSLSPMEIVVLTRRPNGEGITPLQIAIERRNLSAVKRLVIQGGDDLTRRGDNNWCPLRAALDAGGEMTDYFLSPWVWTKNGGRTLARGQYPLTDHMGSDVLGPLAQFRSRLRYYLDRRQEYLAILDGMARLRDKLAERGADGRTVLDLHKHDGLLVGAMIKSGGDPLTAGPGNGLLFPRNDEAWYRPEFREFEDAVLGQEPLVPVTDSSSDTEGDGVGGDTVSEDDDGSDYSSSPIVPNLFRL